MYNYKQKLYDAYAPKKTPAPITAKTNPYMQPYMGQNSVANGARSAVETPEYDELKPQADGLNELYNNANTKYGTGAFDKGFDYSALGWNDDKINSYKVERDAYSANYKNYLDTASSVRTEKENAERKREQEYIAQELLKKYMPTQLKNQGLGGLGVSQSAMAEMDNDYRNRVNNVNSSAENANRNYIQKYKDAYDDMYLFGDNTVDKQLGAIDDARQETAYNEADADLLAYEEGNRDKTIQEIFDKYKKYGRAGSERYNEIERRYKKYMPGGENAASDFFTDTNERFPLNSNGNYSYMKKLPSGSMAAWETFKIADTKGKVPSELSNDNFKYSGHDKDGSKQQILVKQILDDAKAGKIPDGQIVCFNYGNRLRNDCYYLYKNGKFYQLEVEN